MHLSCSSRSRCFRRSRNLLDAVAFRRRFSARIWSDVKVVVLLSMIELVLEGEDAGGFGRMIALLLGCCRSEDGIMDESGGSIVNCC